MEAEVDDTYYVAQEICAMRLKLNELGHQQPATPIKCDNMTAVAFLNDVIKHTL